MSHHYHDPCVKDAYVGVCYRDFSEYSDYDDYGPYGDCAQQSKAKHRGLGVNANMTVRVLRKHGVKADVVAVNDANDVRKWLSKHAPTHLAIQGLWLTAEEQTELCTDFPDVHFVVRCHSQIGFLQVEPRAIRILRDLMRLQEGLLNLSVSSNTHRLRHFVEHSYHTKILYLPNLYDMERSHIKRDEPHSHRLLRISSFGAHRLLKNHTTALAAAMLMARRRQSDLEFYVNAGRQEGPHAREGSVLQSLRAISTGVPWLKLVEVPWGEHASFRHHVAHMDLCMQVSFTETFNIVTCDAISEGVPSVVGPAIEWAPDSWKTDTDDAEKIARTGSHLLSDTQGAREGFEHLERYTKDSVSTWLHYLSSNPTV